MNTHLTTSQLDALLFDTEAAASNQHLRTCEACAAELASLRDTFASLRSATAAAAAHHQLLAARPQRSSMPMRLVGSLATAALILGIGLPIALHHATPVRPAVIAQQIPQATAAKPSSSTTLSDDQLLTTVQGDLSASVPDPMLPLASNPSNQSN